MNHDKLLLQADDRRRVADPVRRTVSGLTTGNLRPTGRDAAVFHFPSDDFALSEPDPAGRFDRIKLLQPGPSAEPVLPIAATTAARRWYERPGPFRAAADHDRPA